MPSQTTPIPYALIALVLMSMAIAPNPSAIAQSAPSAPDRSTSRFSSAAIQNALDLAARSGLPARSVQILLLAADQAQSAGFRDEALRYLEQALPFAQNVDEPVEQVRLLLELVDAYETLQAEALALATLDQAAAIAPDLISSSREPLQRAEQLAAIARFYADRLQPAQAATLLTAADEVARTASPSEQQAILLSTLAIQFEDLGQHDRATALMAESQTVWAATQVDAPPDSILEPTPWSGSVGLASSIFSGERTRGIATFSAGAERQWSRDALDLALSLTYDFDRDREDTDEFSGQILADGLHYFSDDLQYFVNASATSDNLENLNLRARLATGVGFNIWRAASARRLDLRVGVSARYENFVDENTEFNPISSSLGLNYQDTWFGTLRLKQSLIFDVPLDDASDYLFQSQTDLGIPISDRWSFNNTARLTLSGDPAEDNPGLLFNLQTGLRYEF